MIESITFRNFKVLRDTTLPLEPLTLIIGPNGSGKSTVFRALESVARRSRPDTGLVPVGALEDKALTQVQID